MACKRKQTNLRNAIAAVESGKSLSAASREFAVPKSTLYGHTSGLCTVLQYHDEHEIVQTAMCWQIWDLGPQGSLYKRWWQTMCKKWHCQSILTWNSMQRLVAVFFETLAHTGRAQTTTLKQKKGTASQQQLHYSILWCFGEELSYANTANRLWNCDETAFCSSATSTKLLCRRGAKTLHEIGGRSGREYITVHVACSASGACLPPFILYKGKNINNGWRQALLVQCMEISD